MSKETTYAKELVDFLSINEQAQVAYIDTDQRYVFTNSTYSHKFGLTPSEIVGKNVKGVLGEENYKVVHAKLEKALAGMTVSYEDEFKLQDKLSFHFRADYMPHFNDQGKITGCFILVKDLHRNNESEGMSASRSFSSKKGVPPKVPSTVDTGAEDIDKTKLELEQILNTVGNGIALIDTEKNILRANRAMLRMSGLSSNENVAGLKCHELFPVIACGSENCPLQKILSGEKLVSFETERKRQDGSTFPCEITARPLLDKEGNLIGMVEDVRDITGKMRRKDESEFLLQQAIQAEKLAALGTVVAGVAHEINNPNSFISYNAPMAEKIWQGVKPVLDEYAAENPQWKVGHFSYQELAESMSETLQFIRTGSERINTIVNSLKEFSGKEIDQQDSFVQLNDIVTQAYTIIGAQVRKQVGSVAVNLADNLPEILGKFQRLEQVVVNLILNAMAAVKDKKTGRISISTQYNASLKAVLFTVEDNGDGIKKDIMDRIFDPFFTTRRDQGGTGLGLSVTFGLVKEHQGSISINSLPGKGTRFTVFLPLDKSKQKKIKLRPTVLCIDDEKHILNLVEAFFKRTIDDLALATTDNPEHILTYLDEHPEVELIFSDVMMPNINGWDLLTQVKNKFPLMPMILFSADPTALIQPDEAPAPDHVMLKPFSVSQLHTIIKNIDRRIV